MISKFKCHRVLILLLISCLVFKTEGQSRSLKNGKVNSKNYYEEISFEFEKNKIIIPVEIEGKTYRFLLDTGAPNIISKEVRDAIKPKLLVTQSTNDANEKSQDLDIVSIKSLKLGKTEFLNFSALVFDLNGSDIFKCFEIDGFIGSNLFRKSIIQIDAKKKVVKITNKPGTLNLDKKESTKIKLVNNQRSPYIWINLEGKDEGKEMVLIDTGMGRLYDLASDNYKIFKEKKIFNQIGKSDGASSVSLFGEVPINSQVRVHLPKLKINTFEINNVITHTTKGDHSKIGAELLNHGVMTIDYKNKRFYFNSYKESLDLNGDYGLTQTLKNNQLVIGYVWDNDLKTKIKYGDEILEINGEVLDSKNLCNYIAKKSVLKNSKSVTLKVKTSEGKVLDLTLNKKPLSKIFEELNNN